MLALELNTDNTLEDLPPLQPGGHGIRDYQQECQIWTLLTIEHPFQMSLGLTGHDASSGPCSNMASFLHELWLASADGTAVCVYQQ